MDKHLFEMSLEELWTLFPIILSPYESCWEDWYEEERRSIAPLLPGARISHIGSTAIPRIQAKPIVDILIEIPPDASIAEMRERLEDSGWICMRAAENRASLNKGYTPQGYARRVFHIHLRYEGDNDELYFRDYMNDHPALAEAYEKLKLSLWKKYEHDRDAYTGAKSTFIQKYTSLAKAEYGQRYETDPNTKEERG